MNMINWISINNLTRFTTLKLVYDAIKHATANSKQLILSYLKTFLFAENVICKQLPKVKIEVV
jgi:hypothetical protein